MQVIGRAASFARLLAVHLPRGGAPTLNWIEKFFVGLVAVGIAALFTTLFWIMLIWLDLDPLAAAN